MDAEPDTFEVRFDDVVNVASPDGMRPNFGIAVGAWYIIEGMGHAVPGMIVEHASTLPAHSRFSVGHGVLGKAIARGLEFREAQRIARALDDAGLDIEAEIKDPDSDINHIIDAIIGSALMDHYVFPIAGWSV